MTPPHKFAICYLKGNPLISSKDIALVVEQFPMAFNPVGELKCRRLVH